MIFLSLIIDSTFLLLIFFFIFHRHQLHQFWSVGKLNVFLFFTNQSISLHLSPSLCDTCDSVEKKMLAYILWCTSISCFFSFIFFFYFFHWWLIAVDWKRAANYHYVRTRSTNGQCVKMEERQKEKDRDIKTVAQQWIVRDEQPATFNEISVDF